MIHQNTWESWQKCQEDDNYTVMKWRVAKFFLDNDINFFTDRQVKERMFYERLIPHDDMNMVRPKITSLIRDGFLRESERSTFDKATERHVRLVTWQGRISLGQQIKEDDNAVPHSSHQEV